ncbi:Ankyrin repeat-containing domain [Balamuthia mandrillaris]
MQEATATIDALPDELLCHILGMLPRGMVSVAARTCKRWFACSPARPRRFLCWRTLCGSVSLLRWGLQFNPPPFLTVHVCNWAAEQGQLEVLKWVRERQQQQQQQQSSQQTAAYYTELFPWSAFTAAFAARNGHLDVLCWLREQGCPWDEQTCAYAAMNGQLEVLQWAREQGCPWDKHTCAQAARNGHLEVLKSNNKPFLLREEEEREEREEGEEGEEGEERRERRERRERERRKAEQEAPVGGGNPTTK